jgi:hypothetical protein
MNPLDVQIEALTAILRAQGAVVGIDPEAPDFVKRAWLDMVLGCKECRGEIMGRHDEHEN